MVAFLDASEIPAFVAMEWIDGPDLMHAIQSGIVSDWGSILRIARDLARIIYKAHQLPERVLHRDIRPPNVMLKDFWTNGGELDVVVMDFDLSWHVNALEKSVVAKPLGFMAPEQLQHRSKESTRSALVDSFGFGMTMFYMLTREIPVPGQQQHKQWESSLHNHVRAKSCPEWKSVSYRISRLIQGATQDRQGDRWDFARILAEIESLYNAVDVGGGELSVDYHAEEIAVHAETMLNYEWDDSSMSAIYVSGGLRVEISGDAPADKIKLSMGWQQTGEENWKLLPKTSSQVRERMQPILEKYGWSGAKFETAHRAIRITASTSTRFDFNPKKLAKGVDMLVHVMLPKE